MKTPYSKLNCPYVETIYIYIGLMDRNTMQWASPSSCDFLCNLHIARFEKDSSPPCKYVSQTGWDAYLPKR